MFTHHHLSRQILTIMRTTGTMFGADICDAVGAETRKDRQKVHSTIQNLIQAKHLYRLSKGHYRLRGWV